MTPIPNKVREYLQELEDAREDNVRENTFGMYIDNMGVDHES